MKFQVPIETILVIIKYWVKPISCWPPLRGSTPQTLIWHQIILWTAAINIAQNVATTIWTIGQNLDDFYRVVQLMAQTTALSTTVAKMIICNVQAPNIEMMITDLQTFLKQATTVEKQFFQNYMDNCLFIHLIACASICLGPIAYIAGPLVIPQPFPGDIEYPFSIESYWVWTPIYISHSIATIQTGCAVVVDVLFGVLLWYTGARFRLLSAEFRRAKNIYEVKLCIKKHQALIRFAEQVKIPTRIIATEVTFVAVCAVTFTGFLLFKDPPIYDLAKYVCFECASTLELFLLTWPADNLILASEGIAEDVYNSNWIGKSPDMLKTMLIVVQRCREPVTISVAGILPNLSLEFYGSTMAATFSYLTTLRAMAGE